ncbi:MAG: hypothetical protein JSV19_08610 [Phycisphaerales bacterium]|nr:MAG: hypothetical protein JSV19_08610 [Phycisphaerales bacterium]
MNKLTAPIAAGAVALVLVLGVYFATPALRSPQARVDAEADRLVETSRRLLWRFSANQDRLAVLLDALNAAGVDTTLPDAKIAEIPQKIDEILERQGVDPFEEERVRLGEIAGSGVASGLGQGAAAIQKGRAARDEILAWNEQYLTQALETVDKALATTRGDATGAEHLAANRLKGAILYHQGLAAHRRAQVARSRANGWARELVGLVRQVETSQAQTNLVAESKIQQRIADAEATRQKLTQRAGQLREKIDGLRNTIGDLSGRLDRARKVADDARAAMEALEEAGVDLTDAQGFEKFSAAYSAQAKTYREAIRQSQELQFGTLRNARIDDSGDFLHGQYVPASDGEIEAERGLQERQRDLDQLQTQLAVITDQIEANQGDAAALNKLKTRFDERQDQATKHVGAAREQAQEVYERFRKSAAAADEAEVDALAKLDQALRALRAAEQAATERTTRVDQGGMSREKWERMPGQMISGDEWIPANMRFQSADVLVRKGVVHFDRYRGASSEIKLLGQVTELLALPATDSDALVTKRDNARQNGTAAADEAVQLLSRSARPLEQHWTLPAQAAAAQYLLVLFGEEAALDTVIANYEQATEDRGDSPHVEAYRQRLDLLERR